jgi:hypothetical protein
MILVCCNFVALWGVLFDSMRVVMKILLNRLVVVFFVVFFPAAVCLDGQFRGTGEAEVHGILAAPANVANYPLLHHNRWYSNHNLQQNVFHVAGGCEADIEFTRPGGLFVVEVKSSQVSIGALGMTIGAYVYDQLPKQVMAYPVGTTIKIVLDIRTLGVVNRQNLVNSVTATGTIVAANVGFLTAPGGVPQLVDSLGVAWWP